jgi:hypothetical protein
MHACCTIVNFQSSMDYMKTFLVCYIYEKYHVCVCVLWVFTMLSDLAALSSHSNDEKLARHTSDSNRRKLFGMHAVLILCVYFRVKLMVLVNKTAMFYHLPCCHMRHLVDCKLY